MQPVGADSAPTRVHERGPSGSVRRVASSRSKTHRVSCVKTHVRAPERSVHARRPLDVDPRREPERRGRSSRSDQRRSRAAHRSAFHSAFIRSSSRATARACSSIGERVALSIARRAERCIASEASIATMRCRSRTTAARSRSSRCAARREKRSRTSPIRTEASRRRSRSSRSTGNAVCTSERFRSRACPRPDALARAGCCESAFDGARSARSSEREPTRNTRSILRR
jgi:hypothetical protein